LILVDTSVWIEFLRGRLKVRDSELDELAVCGPIIQEVLQGLDGTPASTAFRKYFTADVRILEELLPADLFRHAAEIYRNARQRGYTIRSSTDCLIAAIALRNNVAVWHADRDFEHIARFTGLQTRRHTPAN
jgi:predicted nucleic acid-binding protein